jgi:hypothetical protein
VFAALTIGNTVGPQVYLSTEAPYYLTGLYVDIGCWCVEFLLIIAMGFYLKYLNRQQEAKRVALGLPANIKDISIMPTAEAEAYKIELAEMMRRAGLDYAKATEGSFDDMTDVSDCSYGGIELELMSLASEPPLPVCIVGKHVGHKSIVGVSIRGFMVDCRNAGVPTGYQYSTKSGIARPFY